MKLWMGDVRSTVDSANLWTQANIPVHNNIISIVTILDIYPVTSPAVVTGHNISTIFWSLASSA